MARKPQAPKQVNTITHDEASRKNIPTAELQSISQRMEEDDPFAPVTYPREKPLSQGETRPRDTDLDPQIIWKGMSLKLSPEQMVQLTATGKLEIGEAQLTWRGKDSQDWSDLVVAAPPLYIQEKIHPKTLIDDLARIGKEDWSYDTDAPDLFNDFNGLDDPEAKTEFYAHDQHWSNRMILGDSLQVMASLSERENLRGKVQCIYFDPPYGIKFNSNWQVSTRSRDVKDGKIDQITREPEQVKAFRDTWADGIHSYLTYLRDRLTAMRDLLTDSGSIFVQIGDENVHRVRALMDEVFGEENFVSLITFKKTHYLESDNMSNISDFLLFYAKDLSKNKHRKLWKEAALERVDFSKYTRAFTNHGIKKIPMEWREDVTLFEKGWRPFRNDITLTQDGDSGDSQVPWLVQGKEYFPGAGRHWRTHEKGRERLSFSNRVNPSLSRPFFIEGFDDSPSTNNANIWTKDLAGAQGKVYVVQTNERIVQRCILMATDPGDLVLDPTCGSGTAATVAEQWGRRWITIDTSRVALALARTRLMSARYPYYLLADSPDGRAKEQDVSGQIQPTSPTHGDIRQGFVYQRAPHITLKSIANNAEIDVIWQTWQQRLEPLRQQLNQMLGTDWEEWQIPRQTILPWPDEAIKLFDSIVKVKAVKTKQARLKQLNHLLERDYSLETLPDHAGDVMPEAAHAIHGQWWEARIARQTEIDKSIAQKADVEMLYDRPYEDKSRVRVAGPFTVESLSPHRVVPSDEEELVDLVDFGQQSGMAAAPEAQQDSTEEEGRRKQKRTHKSCEGDNGFVCMVLENLKTAGVQQSAKDDHIDFSDISGWPGDYICAEGHFEENGVMKRAAIFIGPEFGTVSRVDLVTAAREATEARFDTLIACAFNFDGHTSEVSKLGHLPILKAKMNPDLHMSDELKNTGKGNMFIVFGEPDIEWKFDEDGKVVVKVLGVDVFDPTTGDVRSSGKNEIAAWFIDTSYNEESFFVRHAYFLGANDPYKALKTSLKSEINKEAWETLYRDTSRPFPRPSTGRFAIKVINHFGDEVMKVFEV